MTILYRQVTWGKYDSSIFCKGNADIRNEKPLDAGMFSVGRWELAKAIAEGILTRTFISNKEILPFARSYFITTPFFLGEKDGFIAYRKDNEKILRDFSKTTRNGEIAQGLGYLAAKKVLNAQTVYDFDYYTSEIAGIGRAKGKKPDYVLVYRDGSIGLMETKGTLKANPTDTMKSGKKQNDEGNLFLRSNGVVVKNDFVVATSFGTDSQNLRRNTNIYIADPESEDDTTRKEAINLKYEYAKWFYLAGDFNNANKLIKNEAISLKTDYDEINIGRWFAEDLDGRLLKFILGIRRELAEMLIAGELEPIDFEGYIEGDSEFFTDGSFIRCQPIER